MWEGGPPDGRILWIAMKLPEGHDWFEYSIDAGHPTVQERGDMNHLSLVVPSVAAAYKVILSRGYQPPGKPLLGRDGKWQLNLFDPDFTRTELMEPKPVQTPCCSPMRDP